jgi:hypothetical protein
LVCRIGSSIYFQNENGCRFSDCQAWIELLIIRAMLHASKFSCHLPDTNTTKDENDFN